MMVWKNEGGTTSRGLLQGDIERARSIWSGYLWGQLANVGKAAVWWSTFGILAVSMLGSDLGLAGTRGPFNLALLVSSPLAVACAEKLSIRKLLLVTTVGRCLIWSVLVPIGWWFLSGASLWALIVTLMFVDGVHVAFSNAVDIDCGGLDSLSLAYDLPLTDFLRYKYTQIHQFVFDSSFILFTPPTVLIFTLLSHGLRFDSGVAAADSGAGVAAADSRAVPAAEMTSHTPLHVMAQTIAGTDHSVLILALGVAVVFGVLSCLSAVCYIRYIPPTPPITAVAVDPEEGEWPHNTGATQSLTDSYIQKMEDVVDGSVIVMSSPAFKWRLFLLSMETAMEDCMVSVILPILALNATGFLAHTQDKTVAALISVLMIAAGKLGGVLAGMYVATNWAIHEEQTPKSLQKLFRLVLFSSLSLLLVPWGYYGARKALSQGSIIPLDKTIPLDKSIPLDHLAAVPTPLNMPDGKPIRGLSMEEERHAAADESPLSRLWNEGLGGGLLGGLGGGPVGGLGGRLSMSTKQLDMLGFFEDQLHTPLEMSPRFIVTPSHGPSAEDTTAGVALSDDTTATVVVSSDNVSSMSQLLDPVQFMASFGGIDTSIAEVVWSSMATSADIFKKNDEVLIMAADIIVPPTPAPKSDSAITTLLVSPPASIAIAACLVGIFLFFVLSTAPKIGFAALIQGAFGQEEAQAAKVFGYVGMFVTVTDAAMITFINLVFHYIGPDRTEVALAVVVGIYIFHGLFEWLYGLKLVREQDELGGDEYRRQ